VVASKCICRNKIVFHAKQWTRIKLYIQQPHSMCEIKFCTESCQASMSFMKIFTFRRHALLRDFNKILPVFSTFFIQLRQNLVQEMFSKMY
jgi:predicted DNA-binding protein YlxM (UPF0122 family)